MLVIPSVAPTFDLESVFQNYSRTLNLIYILCDANALFIVPFAIDAPIGQHSFDVSVKHLKLPPKNVSGFIVPQYLAEITIQNGGVKQTFQQPYVVGKAEDVNIPDVNLGLATSSPKVKVGTFSLFVLVLLV